MRRIAILVLICLVAGACSPRMVTRPVELGPFPQGLIVESRESDYEVQGNNADEIFAALIRIRPTEDMVREEDQVRTTLRAGEHLGRIEYHVDWAYIDNICRVVDVRIQLDTTMILPRWQAPAGASPELVRQWELFTRLTREHEEEHRRNFLQLGAALLDSLRRVTASSCPDISQAVEEEAQRLSAEGRRQDEQLDSTFRVCRQENELPPWIMACGN